MFANAKLTILLGFTLCGKSFSEFRNNGLCSMPLETIAAKTLYFGVDFKANYYDAINFCRAHGMHLVSIESEEEQKGIMDYLQKSPYRNEPIWTSGNDLGKEGDFKWLSTGRRIGYKYWAGGQPDNVVRDGASENCLGTFSDYRWNDYFCTEQLYFVCEIRQ